MGSPGRLSPEVRERAVRMVHEQGGEYPSQRAAIEALAPKLREESGSPDHRKG